ncbi:MAG: TonB-dependent receptor plug domain-containing protein, partial [Bacteroidales bacterium]|nr:TonB-dependent receptor plug domain-containing protein [Bacteroidales bacterium]
MKQKLTAFVYFILSNFVLVAQQDSTVSTLIDMSLKDLMNIPISGHSRYKQSLDEVSSSIIVLTNHQIKERGYSDLSDLLKDVPGFDITDNAGRFGEFYSIRGIAGNDRFLVLIDGHKLNPPSGTFLSVGNSINICKAVRVEIIFGPASAIYGADAFSGIINIVFIDDNEDVDEAENGSKNISATLNYGSFNSINVALQSIVKFTDDLSFQICARQYTSEGFSVVGSDTLYDFVGTYADILEDVDIQKINDHNIYTYLRYRNFSLNYYRQQFDEGNAMGLNPQIYIYSAENKWKTTTDMWWIDYKKEFENGGNLNFDISYLVHLQDKNSLFYKWLIPGITVDTYKQFMTGKDKALRSEISYNQVFSDKFQFIVGLDFETTSSIPPYANDEILGVSSIYDGNNATIINDNLSIK